MKKNLIEFIKHPTSLHVIINTLGNYLNVFFTAFFAWILARILTPEQYGVLSILLGIAYVLANILDFGTTATIYSYLPPLLQERAKDAGTSLYRFVKSTFYYQSLFASIVILVLFITFPYLDKIFFKTGAPLIELYLTTFSVLLFIWQNFVMNILFAAKKFVHANAYLNISNLVKTVVIVIMWMTGNISIGSVIFVFGILGPVIFFVLLALQRRDLLFVLAKAEVRREEFRFSYTLTYFIASQFYNLALRMDLFLLSYFGLRMEAGYYGLAQKIVLTIITTIISITQVLSPAFSDITTKKEVLKHLKTALLYLLIPSAIFVALFFTPEIIFTWVFTDKFKATAEISHILALPFILNALGSAPMLFLLYTVKKPRYILWSNVIFFIIITAGSYYLIPLRGMFGPPIAITIAFAVAIGMQCIAAYYEYQKLPK